MMDLQTETGEIHVRPSSRCRFARRRQPVRRLDGDVDRRLLSLASGRAPCAARHDFAFPGRFSSSWPGKQGSSRPAAVPPRLAPGVAPAPPGSPFRQGTALRLSATRGGSRRRARGASSRGVRRLRAPRRRDDRSATGAGRLCAVRGSQSPTATPSRRGSAPPSRKPPSRKAMPCRPEFMSVARTS